MQKNNTFNKKSKNIVRFVLLTFLSLALLCSCEALHMKLNIEGEQVILNVKEKEIELVYAEYIPEDAVYQVLDALVAKNPEAAASAGTINVNVGKGKTVITTSQPIQLAPSKKALASFVEEASKAIIKAKTPAPVAVPAPAPVAAPVVAPVVVPAPAPVVE
ncbi:MAG: hypothetical protein WCR70_04060, partial [Sphaerochaetaceae bacterium]